MFEAHCTSPGLGAVERISGETRLVAMVANITLGNSWDEAHDCQTQELLLQNSDPKDFTPQI
jgi:formiminotetrahydrofolate cyclodeaminase